MILSAVLLVVCALAAASATDPVDVFTPGLGGVAQFRIPALVRTSKATLIAFAEARMHPETDCGYKWIVARRSETNGSTWGPLIDVVGREWGQWATGNVQPFFHAPSGRIVAVVGSKDLSQPGRLCEPGTAVFALDDGGSDGLYWGPARNISGALASARGGATLLPGPGTGLVLSRTRPGRLLAVGLAGGAYSSEAVFWSDDVGLSWSVAGVEVGPGVDEANLVELGDGTVYLSMRSTQARQAYALSSNGGETWGPVTHDPALITPQCEASVAAYSGALYFANPASEAVRANITIRRTASGAGPTQWQTATHLVAPGITWGGYTSMPKEPISDTLSGILFERNTTTTTFVISFATFPLDF